MMEGMKEVLVRMGSSKLPLLKTGILIHERRTWVAKIS